MLTKDNLIYKTTNVTLAETSDKKLIAVVGCEQIQMYNVYKHWKLAGQSVRLQDAIDCYNTI